MITVKATEFHNKVGYYLDLLAKGKKIKIVSTKPKKEDLVLEGHRSVYEFEEGRIDRIMDAVRKKQYKAKYWKNGLELQDTVRD
jgi:hypothetical protein